MDEKQAWECFAHTGKIEDYIRYAQLKNQARGAYGLGREGERAAADPGAYHPRAGSGGERPAGYGID